MKHWKRYKNVPLKSYLVELLVAEFFKTYKYKHQSYYYFDWFVRDFLEFLISKRNTTLYSPGSGKFINLGDDWANYAQWALGKAKEACDLEYQDFPTLAGNEWTNLFGNRIPVMV